MNDDWLVVVMVMLTVEGLIAVAVSVVMVMGVSRIVSSSGGTAACQTSQAAVIRR